MREQFSLVHPLRVRWSEVDRQGIVFNGHYLTYFDIAITEYWRAVGLRYPEDIVGKGSDLYVVRAVVEYQRSAEYDEVIDVCARCQRIGRSSMRFALAILRGEDLLVSGELVYVNADPASRKPVPVPEWMRELMRRFERVAPEEEGRPDPATFPDPAGPGGEAARPAV